MLLCILAIGGEDRGYPSSIVVADVAKVARHGEDKRVAGSTLGLTAKLLPAALLVACLTPTIALEARMLPPEWTDGTPANFITADGYYIRTADGYLLCVQEI